MFPLKHLPLDAKIRDTYPVPHTRPTSISFLVALLCALSAHSASLVFLGVEHDGEPLLGKALTEEIHWHLSGDTTLQLEPMNEVDALISRRVLKGPLPDVYELRDLQKRLNRQYAAYGRLRPVGIESKRVLWMPWHMKVTFHQTLELRVSDMTNNETLLNREVRAETVKGENGLWGFTPWAERSPLERNRILEELKKNLAQETARAVGEALKPPAAEAPAAEAAPP